MAVAATGMASRNRRVLTSVDGKALKKSVKGQTSLVIHQEIKINKVSQDTRKLSTSIFGHLKGSCEKISRTRIL